MISNEKWLIAVDLDGTLFGADHQVSLRTVDVLNAVAQQGHAIVVVTGRSAYSAISRISCLPPGARIICSNGAYEFDRISNAIVWSQTLSATSAIQLRKRILEKLPSASFGWELASGLNYEDKFIREAGGAHTLEQGGSCEELGKSGVLKLYVRTPQFVCGDLQQQLLPLLGGQVEASTSGVPFVELTAQGVDKASGLARVASELGYTASRTIAFGDNLNDLPMLRWAFEAVAMGNAMDEVKSMACTHTLDNINDGVATLLENRLRSGEL